MSSKKRRSKQDAPASGADGSAQPGSSPPSDTSPDHGADTEARKITEATKRRAKPRSAARSSKSTQKAAPAKASRKSKAADSSKSGKRASEGGATTDDEAAKPKRSLPAFGFATDLLKKKDDSGGASEAGAASETVTLDVPEDAAVARIAHGVRDASADDDPHRLFSFADQIQARQLEEEQDQGPKARWETWVTFSLADETFAMPVEPVRQIVRVANITRVPHAPRPVRGVTNLRGRVIPVIDLRMRVGLDPGEIDRQSRVVAVASRGRILGLLVDAVHQVVHLDLNQVQPPPEDVMTVQSDYILGVYHQEDALILLLDVDRSLVLREEAVA